MNVFGLDLVQLIESDPSLAVRLLKLANSRPSSGPFTL